MEQRICNIEERLKHIEEMLNALSNKQEYLQQDLGWISKQQ